MTRQGAKTFRAIAALFVSSLAAQHLGVYDWAGSVNALPSPGALERFGADTVRIFLGGKYDYVKPENAPGRFAEIRGPVTLAKIAALPRYRALFRNPKVPTVWLTAYPVFDYGQGPVEMKLTSGIPPERDWREASDQMTGLVDMLYREHGSENRVVLISNNETDEKLREIASAGGDRHNEARYLDRLRIGADNARARYRKAKLKVLFGVEIKLWKQKLPDGTTALDAILPKLHYDFVSFSAWEVEEHPETIYEALDDIARRTRAGLTPLGREVFGDHHVLIGEYGYAREWKIPLEPLFRAFLGAASPQHAPYVVYWQLYDNASGGAKQFGLLDAQGRATPAGEILQTWKAR